VGKSNLISLTVIGIALSVLLFSSNVMASSFPFRSVSPGVSLPIVTLSEVGTDKVITIDQTNNQNTILVFWAADNSSKKKRALKTMKIIGKSLDFLNEKKISLYIVNAGNDSPEIINEVTSASDLSVPIYLDSDLKAYGELGIFVMPSILMVDKEGKIAAGMGYSRDLKRRFKGEVEVMLGEKDRAQFEEELRPKTVEKSKEEKSANRHFKQGLAMIQRGQTEAAIKEFKMAIESNPSLTKAHIQIGCLYVDIDKIDLAKEALAKGLENDPDSLDGLVCKARIKAKEGDVAEAIDDLQFLMMRNSRNANLRYVLAKLFVIQGRLEDAVKEYDSAYDLLLKKYMHE
jgi:Flp pilus assembly protein TadD